MRIRLLGDVELLDGDQVVPLGGPQQRRLLAALALRAGEVVAIDRLMEVLWDDSPPMTAAKTLQGYITRLRKTLDDGSGVGIEFREAGYVLRAPDDGIDVHVALALADRARAAVKDGAHDEAATLFGAALALWRGRSLGELADEDFARGRAVQLEELRLSLAEEHIEAELACGRRQSALLELETLCASNPLRERLWALRMLALYRTGRQAEALRVYQELRRTLVDELGIEPSPELRQLERRVLTQDPGLLVEVPDTNAAEHLPAGTVTFLVTDIERSSALWEQHGEAMAGALAKHDDLIARAVAAAGGAIFKRTGDGVFAVFASASPAIVAAVDAQRSLTAHDWSPLDALRVRMALHSGEARPEGRDYVSPVLHRAARLATIAHGGQILASQVTVDLVADATPLDVSVVHLGEHRLRDLARAERVFQIAHPQLRTSFPRLRSLDTHRHNLPVHTTRLIGRDDDVRALIEIIQADGLVTLVGPGGVGKTRLALQTAADAVNRYADGVWLCELASVVSGDDVPSAFVNALSLAPTPGRTSLDSLLDFLQERHTLLVIDNCEHVLAAAAPLVEAIRSHCPAVHLIATSREALDIEGERTWPVRSLSVPASADEADVEGVIRSDAAQLLLDRARAVRPDIAIDEGNARSVAAICRRLDGIPLAIELAAARLRSMSPGELERRLDDAFRLLTGGRRTALERHRTLRGAVAWSHELLDDRERALFRRLAVFTGGFDLEAAEAVGAGDPVDRAEVLDVLDGLVAKSMVIADEHGPDTRYRLLETLRQFALEQVGAAGEADTIGRRHAAHFAALADRAATGVLGPDELEWVARLERDIDNLRTGVLWAIDADEADLALPLFGALSPFLLLYEPLGLMVSSLADAALQTTGAAEHRCFERACVWSDFAASYRADFDAMGRGGANAVELAAARGRTPAPETVISSSASAMIEGRVDEIFEVLRQATTIARGTGDRFVVASTLQVAAMVMMAFTDPQEDSLDMATEAVQLARSLGIPSLLSSSLSSLGLALQEVDDDAALRAYEESMLVGGTRTMSVIATARTARLRCQRGDRSALHSLIDVIDRLHAAGNRGQLALVLTEVSGVLADLGQEEHAAELVGALTGGVVNPHYSIQIHHDARGFASLRNLFSSEASEDAARRGAALSYEQTVERARRALMEAAESAVQR